MNTLTLTSKTGKTVVLSSTGRGVLANIPAIGNLGRDLNVHAVEEGFKTNFGQKIVVQFSGADLVACQKFFAAEDAAVKTLAAERAAYQARHDYINAVR